MDLTTLQWVIRHLGVTSAVAGTGVGVSAATDNIIGANNVAIGRDTATGNFSSSIILGRAATATAANQFVVGSAAYNAGTVTTEVVVSDTTWAVRINGTAYKILLKA